MTSTPGTPEPEPLHDGGQEPARRRARVSGLSHNMLPTRNTTISSAPSAVHKAPLCLIASLLAALTRSGASCRIGITRAIEGAPGMKHSGRVMNGDVIVGLCQSLDRRLARVEMKLDALIAITLAQFAIVFGGLWAIWSQLAALSTQVSQLAG